MHAKTVGLVVTVALAMGLAGCGGGQPEQPVEPTATMATLPAADNSAGSDKTMAASGRRYQSWAGRWIGVEGMVLDITPLGDQRYSLEMQSDLDTRGIYEGREDEHGIRFERGGEPLMLRLASGDDTGLKWLAGKQQCLMVRDGEGYCRD